MMERSKLMAEYGEALIQQELLQSKILNLKQQIAGLLNEKEVKKDDKPKS